MQQGKRWLACLCAAVLMLGICLGGTARADEVEIYQVAENDKMVELSLEAMPAWIDGAIYVPYVIFDQAVTQVSLGVSYGQSRTDTEYKLTLYSLNGTLIFDLNNGTCVDGFTGESKNMKAVLRNGRAFVPLAEVCRHFGLNYTYTPTAYGTLIRITNGAESLSTADFVEAAASLMRTRYSAYLQQMNATTQPQDTPTPSPTSTQGTQTTEPDRPGGQVSLAFQYTGAGGLDRILEQLEQYGIRALFLFRPEELAEHDDEIRQVIASGHAIGFSVSGASAAQVQQTLLEGSRQLEHAAHLRTHTAYLEHAPRRTADALGKEGWACWSSDIDARPDGRSQSAQAKQLLRALEGRNGVTTVLLDDSADSVGILRQVLPQWKRDGCRFYLAVETRL